MTDYLNPHRIYPDDISRRIDTPPGFDSVRTPVKNQRGSADKTKEGKNMAIYKSSEMLKEICENKGIEWKSTYAGALGKLLEIFDSEVADSLLQKADERLAAIENTAEIVNKKMRQEQEETHERKKELSALLARADKTIEAYEAIKDNQLKDSKNIETVTLFRQLLQSGRDVFGTDAMTDGAIASLCNAASYIVWRDIMGPKNEENAYKNGYRRI